MSKRDKLRRKLRNNPRGRTKQEVETLLGQFGFVLDRVSGSHHVFILKIGDTRHRIVAPIHGQKVKAVSVKQVIEK
jgi:predicted RNA binding protein YcfA (HicA-like mRNA interferase family)